MNVRLHIDRLVLEGVNVGAPEIEAELARLLADGGLHPALMHGGAVPSLRAPEIAAPSAESIAGAVYGAIGEVKR